jgi:histone H3/H4
MNAICLSQDAMTVLGLAGTALPFAESVDDEVERWLRPLRLYGEAGASLQALGIGEGRVQGTGQEPHEAVRTAPQETLALVTAAASRIAAERGTSTVGTQDILTAVMRHYGEAFERALDRHSGDSAELLERLTARG